MDGRREANSIMSQQDIILADGTVLEGEKSATEFFNSEEEAPASAPDKEPQPDDGRVVKILPNGVQIEQHTYRNGRYYTVEGDESVPDNTRLTSVTTAQGIISKAFLAPWYAKMASEKMAEDVVRSFNEKFAGVNTQMKSPSDADLVTAMATLAIEYGRQGYSVDEISANPLFNVVDNDLLTRAIKYGQSGQYEHFNIMVKDIAYNAKGEARRYAQRAGAIGTIVHEWIEKFLDPEDDPMDLEVPEEPYEAYNAIIAWCKWRSTKFAEMNAKFLEREAMLYHPRGFAGTCDAVLEAEDGSAILLDWKTSARISPDYGIQLGAYADAYEYVYGQVVSAAYIIRLDKQTAKYAQREVDLDKAREFFATDYNAYSKHANDKVVLK